MIYLFTEKFTSPQKYGNLKVNSKPNVNNVGNSFANNVAFGASTINLSVNSDIFSQTTNSDTIGKKHRKHGVKKNFVSNYLKKFNTVDNSTNPSKVGARDNYPVDNPKYLVYYALTRV